MRDMSERDTTFTLRMPRALREALDRAAQSERRTAADVAIIALEEALARAGHFKPAKPTTIKAGSRGRKG